MKFTAVAVSALFFMTRSALAGPLDLTSPGASLSSLGFISIETGLSQTGNRTDIAIERRGPEYVTCFEKGTRVDRAPLIAAINDWCGNHATGTWVPPGYLIWARYQFDGFTVYLTAEARTRCNGFTVDGNCGRLLRLPVDQCDTGGENNKHGGFEIDPCGVWGIDPGSNGSDY